MTARTRPTLASVVSESKPLPDRIVLYGAPGWGKTSFAARMPKPIVLMTPGEDRLKKLIAEGLVPKTPHFPNVAESWQDVLDAVGELLSQPHDYLTFVLDTANGAERLGQEEVCRADFKGDWGEYGFASFGKGERITANRHWWPLLQQLDKLRERRRMRVVLCCHAGIRSTKNPDGPDYDKIEPALSKPGWGFASKWADMILYGAFETNAEKDNPRNKFEKAKGHGGRVRLLYCSPSAAFDAKNCHRLPAVIRLGDEPLRAFDSFRAAFPAPAKREEPTIPAQPAPQPVLASA